MSTAGTDSIVAASFFSDITLTFAITASDFVLPESLLRMAVPIGLKFVLRFIFRAAKEYPDECEKARKDIDKKVSEALKEWIQ